MANQVIPPGGLYDEIQLKQINVLESANLTIIPQLSKSAFRQQQRPATELPTIHQNNSHMNRKAVNPATHLYQMRTYFNFQSKSIPPKRFQSGDEEKNWLLNPKN